MNFELRGAAAAVASFFCVTSAMAQRLGPAPSDLNPSDAAAKAKAACASKSDFNPCISSTVEYIFADRRSRGYKDTAFTKNLDYGPGKRIIKASSPPTTMCVAATSEIAIESLNFYYEATADDRPFQVLPAEGWNRSRRIDIRSYMWENEGPSNKRGAGTAFSTFGVGELIDFKNAKSGDFVSLDRSKFRPRESWRPEEVEKFSKKPLVKHEGKYGVWQTSGHSTIFLNYLNKSLEPTLKYDAKNIVGFLYFSSQGTASTGGFNYRWGIFQNATDDHGRSICLTAKLSAPMDCSLDGIDRSSLRVGRLWNPNKWDDRRRSQLIKELTTQLRSSFTALMGQDFSILRTNPSAPDARLNLPGLPGLREAFKQAPNVASNRPFVDSLIKAEIERENPAFNAEKFDGVTD